MKVGSLVECVALEANEGWISSVTGNRIKGPQYKDICLVVGFGKEHGWLVLDGYEICPETGEEDEYNPVWFREIQPPMDISELIEECQTQTVEI